MSVSINLNRMRQLKKGFSLIEVLISLLLVLIALLFITRILIFTIDGNKKSYILSQVSQQLESYKDHLTSYQFDSKELEPGTSTDLYQSYNIAKTITSISPNLKLIRLSLTYKTIVRNIYFYKSRYIKEVKHD